MESGICRHGKELPPQKTPIILIGDTVAFDLSKIEDDDSVQVLTADENWYTIKKRDILPPFEV